MADGLDASISAAVESVANATPASSADTAAAPSTTTAPADKTSAPSATAGQADAPKPSGKTTGRPTRQAAPDSAPQDLSAQIREKQQRELDNSRKKEREAVFDELAKELGLDLRQPNVRSNIRTFQQNPAGYVKQYASQWGLTLAEARQEIAQQQAQQQPQQPEAEPQPDLVAEDNVTPAYSAPRLAEWWAWQRKQLESVYNQRLEPVEKLMQQLQRAQDWYVANQNAARDVAEARTWPHFKEIEADVKAIIAEDARHTLSTAFAMALTKNNAVLTEKQRNEFLTELKSRPSVGGDPAPAGAVTRANGRAKRSGLDQAIDSAIDQHAAAAR